MRAPSASRSSPCGDDVEPAGLAGGDLDASVEAKMAHQRLEDALAGCEGLGRRLGGLELGAFGGDGAAGGRDLGALGGRQVGGRRRGAAAVVAARAAVGRRSSRAAGRHGAVPVVGGR